MTKGRPVQPGAISRSTARSYGYKAKVLLKDAELAESIGQLDRAKELRARSQHMLKRAAQHWDGTDVEVLKDIKTMEKESEKELHALMYTMDVEKTNLKALAEAREHDKLVAKAQEQLHEGDTDGEQQQRQAEQSDADKHEEVGGADR